MAFTIANTVHSDELQLSISCDTVES